MWRRNQCRRASPAATARRTRRRRRRRAEGLQGYRKKEMLWE